MADLTLETLDGLTREELEKILKEEAKKTFALAHSPLEDGSKKNSLVPSCIFDFMGLKKRLRNIWPKSSHSGC
jgi:hypothetical protein